MIRAMLAYISLMMLSACSPTVVQDYSAAYHPEGKMAYSVDGYTKLNEVKEEDARKHAQKFADDICNQKSLTGTLQRVDTTPNGNKLGRFLYWQAIVVCE